MRFLTATLIAVLGATGASADNDDKDDNVPLESLPQAVRQTIEREVKTAKIVEIDRDQDAGKVIYEVEFMEGNKRFEIDIAEDGKVVRPRRPD